MPYQLVVIKGRSANQALRIPADGVTTVGRQQGCQIKIASSQVSRKHCELFEKKGLLLVKDLGSSNGTLVNGKKIEGQQVLEPGNVLTIGAVSFRIERSGAPAVAAVAVPAGQAGDTAVAEAVAIGGDEDIEVELDFEIADDDDQTVTTTAPPPASKAAKAPAPPPAPAPAAKAAKAPPAPAPAPAPPAPAPAAEPDAIPLIDEGSAKPVSEDAVAAYLMNIELDDEDKL